MPEAYLVEALRTPVGRRNGGLAEAHPADLGAFVLRALVERTGVDPAEIDDVIWGCLDQVGPQSANVGRACWLAAGLPESVPAVTIDRACGSSQQAVHFAAQAVMSGTSDLVIAGGAQNMSMVPLGSANRAGAALGLPDRYAASAGWSARFRDQPVTQFHGAELIASKWGLGREVMESFAVESHRRAIHAIDTGRFAREILPYGDLTADEGPRRDTSAAKLAALPPLSDGGLITAGLASQISDGAAALLVASEAAVARHGLRPRARVHYMTVVGDDPIYMLTGPIPATARAMRSTGLSIDDIDLIEINEAFAPVVLAWQLETGADPARVNVNGGAIALGHPLGATGARLMTSLLHELERTEGRYGLQTMCEGGGLANLTIIERLA